MTEASRGAYRVEIACQVHFTAPLRVGTGERLSLLTDAPLLRDGQGKPWVPGSSIRGVLRDWAEREAPLLGVERDEVIRLFGASPPRRRAATPAAGSDRQGRLTVFDLHVNGSSQPTGRVRDHVAIDRKRGAGKRGGKFDQEVAERVGGTIRMLYEGSSENDPELLLIKAMTDALRDGLLPIGGKTGWGFGALTVESTSHWVVQRKTPAGLSQYLRSRLDAKALPVSAELPAPPVASPRARKQGDPEGFNWVRVTLDLQFDGPMLIADPSREALPSDVSEADAVFQVDAEDRPILAGSSLRGVLNAHARRICQTLRPQPAGATASSDSESIADVLFGTKKPRASFHRALSGRRGMVRVGEGCLVGPQESVRLNHVAIDRVTGFAVDQKLFSSAALASPRFRCTLMLRWRPGRPDELAAVGLLLMLLRDMSQGLLWVGSRTTRGYGRLVALPQISYVLSRVKVDIEHPSHREPQRSENCARIADLAAPFNPELESWKASIGAARGGA